MSASLVGSEMCIRDSHPPQPHGPRHGHPPRPRHASAHPDCAGGGGLPGGSCAAPRVGLGGAAGQ
eukprot:10817773-Alexandrium_andersonii.AAC.1